MHTYLPTFIIFPMHTCRLLGAFFPFFLVPNQHFFIYFVHRTFIPFSKIFNCSFYNPFVGNQALAFLFSSLFFKSNEIIFRRFQNFSNFQLTGSLDSQASHSELTRYYFPQSKIRKDTANPVLRVFRYLCILCNFGEFLPS